MHSDSVAALPLCRRHVEFRVMPGVAACAGVRALLHPGGYRECLALGWVPTPEAHHIVSSFHGHCLPPGPRAAVASTIHLRRHRPSAIILARIYRRGRGACPPATRARRHAAVRRGVRAGRRCFGTVERQGCAPRVCSSPTMRVHERRHMRESAQREGRRGVSGRGYHAPMFTREGATPIFRSR